MKQTGGYKNYETHNNAVLYDGDYCPNRSDGETYTPIRGQHNNYNQYDSQGDNSHTLHRTQGGNYNPMMNSRYNADRFQSRGRGNSEQYNHVYRGRRNGNHFPIGDQPPSDCHDAHRANSKICHIKIPPFTGKEEWATWIARFEAIAYRYSWSEEDKLDQLLPRLEGTAAQFVFAQLPPLVLNDYQELVAAMNSRFRVVQTARSFAAKFSRRNQRPGETAEDFAADLKRLYDKAHGYRDRRTREEDLVRRFLDGLHDEEVRSEVEFNKEPQNIDEAVYHVVNLIQIRNAIRSEKRGRYNLRQACEDDSMLEDEEWTYRVGGDRKFSKTEPRKDRRDMGKSTADQNSDLIIQELKQRIEKLENQKEKVPRKSLDKKEVQCFKCHQMGHYARECPDRGYKPYHKPQHENEANTIANPLNMMGPALAAKGRSN